MSKKEKPKILVRIFFLLYFLYSEILILIYKILDKPLIHVIGDSHTLIFLFKKDFVVKYLGPATAYGLVNRNKNYYKIDKYTNRLRPKKDTLILVFGEIDSRIHIYNQYKKGQERISLKTIIERVISNYCRLILKLKSKNLTIVVYGIPPASPLLENFYKYTYYGTPQERSSISIQFNTLLKKFCSTNYINYIDLQERYSTPKGFIDPNHTKDNIHLSSKIIPFIRRKVYGIISNRC